jgi:transposase
MGANLDLAEGDLKLLAQRIDEILTGHQSLIPYAEAIERLAHKYASQLIHHLSEAPNMQEAAGMTAKPDFATVDLSSIEQSMPRTVGAEHLLLQMADQLQLPQIFKKLNFSTAEIAIALGSIIGRAAYPGSERTTHFWLAENSGLGELLDFHFEGCSHQRLYRISDTLLEGKTILEDHLEKTEQRFHGYQSAIALYDLTNVYMEGQAKSNSKAAHGVSKEKRTDCPLVTLGIVMNEHGFLHHTSIFPGNASEPKTLQEMIEHLHSEPRGLFNPVIILDAGIATEDNLKWLREHQYKYIVSARQKAPSNELEGDLVPVHDRHGFVKAALIKSSEGEEKWLYCESEAKAAVASQMKQSFRKRFEEDLKKVAEGLSKPKGRKKYQKIIERIGRLKEKHKHISGCYEIQVTLAEDGINASSVDWTVKNEKMEEKLTGKYFLRTNLLDKGPEELWQIYNTLRRVEDAFRFMKSSLGLRPVYHQKERRVDGHLWITVLAYHLIQNCLYQLEKKGITYNWKTVRDIVGGRVRVTTSVKTKEGETIHQRSTTKAEGNQLEIYKALGMSPQILQARKTVVKTDRTNFKM